MKKNKVVFLLGISFPLINGVNGAISEISGRSTIEFDMGTMGLYPPTIENTIWTPQEASTGLKPSITEFEKDLASFLFGIFVPNFTSKFEETSTIGRIHGSSTNGSMGVISTSHQISFRIQGDQASKAGALGPMIPEEAYNYSCYKFVWLEKKLDELSETEKKIAEYYHMTPQSKIKFLYGNGNVSDADHVWGIQVDGKKYCIVWVEYKNKGLVEVKLINKKGDTIARKSEGMIKVSVPSTN